MSLDLLENLRSTGMNNKVCGQVEKTSIQIRCKGDFPLLRLTDVRND